MPVVINGSTGITTPGFTSTAASTVSGGALTASGVTLSSGSITYPNADTQAVGPFAGPGSNQSWQDLTASRALSTTYTNSTGRPIAVSVQNAANGSWSSALLVDSITISGCYFISGGGTMTMFAVVPAGSTYRATASVALGSWLELR